MMPPAIAGCHTQAHTGTYTHIHTGTGTGTHRHTHTDTQAQTHTHPQPEPQTQKQKRTHTHTHTHTHLCVQGRVVDPAVTELWRGLQLTGGWNLALLGGGIAEDDLGGGK